MPGELEAKRQKTETVVVVLEHSDLVAGKDLTAEIGKAYGPGGLGILYVRGVPGMAEARMALLPLSRKLALLPDEVLNKYECEKAFYCVGWSRGKEKFRGKPDVAKGSFYANPLYDDPSGGDPEVLEKYPVARPNIWPEEVPELQEALQRMGHMVYDVAKPIVKQIDKLVAEARPGHATTLYDRTFVESKFTVSRLLHYYGMTERDEFGEWCGWHNDNSTITGLVPALWLEEGTGKQTTPRVGAGLFVEGRSGETIHVVSPPDCLGFQIGEAAQILSGGVVHATPHMVKGYMSKEGEPKISRETYACFIQPQWDGELRPPPGIAFESIFEGREESKLIPPLSSRLKEVPVKFGDILQESAAVYYQHNNP
eukprot:CAMPEP_0183389346 /NCGR_PEP_ID=MMETSP0370-20130417/4874_1 /TAXON_ID=268820 /ORGANISM="Peridinium aciculiferum, Strain PAER-2" /LENGTH=368 /DNA_ID=CAMNT_0025568583 /DNA_START=24 /DNA_END=1130 /DNA_ORIENTATION=-